MEIALSIKRGKPGINPASKKRRSPVPTALLFCPGARRIASYPLTGIISVREAGGTCPMRSDGSQASLLSGLFVTTLCFVMIERTLN